MLYFDISLLKSVIDSNIFSSPCTEHTSSLKQSPLSFTWGCYWYQVSKKGKCLWITICTCPDIGILIPFEQQVGKQEGASKCLPESESHLWKIVVIVDFTVHSHVNMLLLCITYYVLLFHIPFNISPWALQRQQSILFTESKNSSRLKVDISLFKLIWTDINVNQTRKKNFQNWVCSEQAYSFVPARCFCSCAPTMTGI